jgi:hypothetical protein
MLHWLCQYRLGAIEHLPDVGNHLVVTFPDQVADFFHNQISYNTPP